MQFGLFYENQLPRPWGNQAERVLYSDALKQIELADELGYDYAWAVEHHFLEEYSHLSSPEVFLAAASQRTTRIRLGHGVVVLPSRVNHPARVAERIATLDLVSDGRVDFGTGESSTAVELEAFGVPRGEKRDQWRESLDAITRMFVESPFAGYRGESFSIPPREVLPKPLQKPHPPLWMACSHKDSIVRAAVNGMGALNFWFPHPDEAAEAVREYEAALTSPDCVPAGFSVNPKFAMVVPLMCHADEATALERGIPAFRFMAYALDHYVRSGTHVPGASRLWQDFSAGEPPTSRLVEELGLGAERGAIGTPEQIADFLRPYERAGVDLVIFIAQSGRTEHTHVCDSMRLFAAEVMPEFSARHADAESAKSARLAQACEAALSRRDGPRRLPGGYHVSARPVSP